MNRLLVLTLLTVVLGGVQVHAQDKSAAHEPAIREAVRKMESGWNTKSGALFASPFADDADYVIINGNYLKGRANIERGHQQIFDTVYKDTTLSLAVQQIRLLRPDVAVVHVKGERRGPNDEAHEAMITLVMTKEKQGWAIAAFQNTAIMTPGP